ncbi:MAG UNVERIFIED_CONTAM: hypothetical protein LVT10_09880 [Anaerolineae bacterium]|jgi:hypothetical protein
MQKFAKMFKPCCLEVDTLFAVLWGEAERDPNRVVETVLDQIAFEVGDAWFGDVRLARYALPPATFGEVHEGWMCALANTSP